MKNAVVKGIGIALLIVGFLGVIGAAGNSDFGAPLVNVITHAIAGVVTMLFGAAMVSYIEKKEG